METGVTRAEMPSAFFSGDICAQMSVITRNRIFPRRDSAAFRNNNSGEI